MSGGGVGDEIGKAKAERIFGLMDGFLKNEPVNWFESYTVMDILIIGCSLSNSVKTWHRDQYADALSQLDFDFKVMAEQEEDATLDDRGLASLSACQMDSLAKLEYPETGEMLYME
ncbi:hypothetical protein AgCh_024520 [Apium graveolens]